MKLTPLAPALGSGVLDRIRGAILQQMPGAEVRVTAGSPGHYSVFVKDAVFQGKSRLECQRLVYKAIGPLMHGDGAPVHAIDQLETQAV